MEKPPLIAIPTYWCKGPLTNDDIIYDHPTDLLNPVETLSKTLKSFVPIKGNFDVLVVGAPTRSNIGKEMDDKLQGIIKSANLPFRVIYIGYAKCIQLKNSLQVSCSTEVIDIVSNEGYGNIRNLCLLISHLLGYDITIMIDDDEIIDDEGFIKKATEFIGKEVDGKILGLVAGYYKNSDGSIFLDESNVSWWQMVWNKPQKMNEAYKIITNGNKRLVKTSFAFGGNMVIHRKCWMVVPFDPEIARGEDMDFLRNVQYHGFEAKLDRELSIIHLPPVSKTNQHEKFVQDAYRFMYACKKAEKLELNTDDYEPYPGYFLKDTEGKILLTELLYMVHKYRDDIIRSNNVQDLTTRLVEKISLFDDVHANAEMKSGSYKKLQANWEILLTNAANDQALIEYRDNLFFL